MTRAKCQAIVIVDGAQGIVHQPTDVQDLDADFYVFSGHKLYAPAGIGVLYGKLAILEAMPPWHGGGKMVEKVSFEGTTFSQLPGKFEAGTPNVAGALALACSIEWLDQYPNSELEQHIHQLQQLAFDGLSQLDDIEIIGFQPVQASSPLSWMVFIIKIWRRCWINKTLPCAQVTTVLTR